MLFRSEKSNKSKAEYDARKVLQAGRATHEPAKAAPDLEETIVTAKPVSLAHEFKQLFFLSIVLVLVLAGGRYSRSVVQPAGKQHVPLPAHGPPHGEFQFQHDTPGNPSNETDAMNITGSKSMEESGDHTLGYGTIPTYATVTMAAVGLACAASEFAISSAWLSQIGRAHV